MMRLLICLESLMLSGVPTVGMDRTSCSPQSTRVLAQNQAPTTSKAISPAQSVRCLKRESAFQVQKPRWWTAQMRLSRGLNLTASIGLLAESTSINSQLLMALQRYILLPCLPPTLANMRLPLRLKPTSLQKDTRISFTTRTSLYRIWQILMLFLKATAITLLFGCTPAVSISYPSSALTPRVLLLMSRFCEDSILPWASMRRQRQQQQVMGLQTLMVCSEVVSMREWGLLQVFILWCSCWMACSSTRVLLLNPSGFSKLLEQQMASCLREQKASRSSCGERRMLDEGSSPRKYSALTSQAFPLFLKKVRFCPPRSRKPEMVPSMLLAFLRVGMVWVSLPSRKATTLSSWQTMSSSLAQQQREPCERELHLLFSMILTEASSCFG